MGEGGHTGCRDILAYASALAEFERAEAEQREASLDIACASFEMDPFKWDRMHNGLLSLFWRSPDGRYHIQTGKIAYFIGIIMKSQQGP